MRKRVRILISGKVQGVYFRGSAKAVATELNLAGWARNLGSGEVEVLAEGPPERVAELVEWCRSGPPLARVERCQVTEEPVMGDCVGFAVKRGR